MNNLVLDVELSYVTMRPRMNKNSGVSIIEFSFVALILIFSMIGITETGLIIYNKILITNASREAARAGIRGVSILAGTYWANIRLIGVDDTKPLLRYASVSDGGTGTVGVGTVTCKYKGFYTSVFSGIQITSSTYMRN